MASAVPPTSTTTLSSSSSMEVTENILYMTLLHELKAAFPAVSDDDVRRCISQFGKDKVRCVEHLTSETERIKRGPYGRYSDQHHRKYSLQALLSHQVDQCLKLERELSKARQEVQIAQNEVNDLEKKLILTQMISQGKVTAEMMEQEISDLRKACDSMADEVTKLTKGTVPLGETSIDFYESLPSALEHEAPCPKYEVATGLQPSSRPDHGSSGAADSSGLVEEQQWPCSACTFLNHPALKNCEECDMPRINLEGPSSFSRLATSTTSSSSSSRLPTSILQSLN